VIAAVGEPDALLPPMVGGSVGRDVSDLIYERLADLPGGGSPLDSSALTPRLASRWERVDPLTLRFHLRSGARWHDSVPVTAADVAFSFGAYADSALDAQARAVLAGRVTATAPDDSTVLIHFAAPDAEQWYDATWHVRVLPRHVWDSIPTGRWAESMTEARLVGSGPYRLSGWVKGQTLTLERTALAEGAAAIRRLVWRFGSDPEAALNLVLSHEADLLETIGDSTLVARVTADSSLRTMPYPAAVYGFLGFNLDAPGSSPVASPEVRRALAMAVDRATAARAALGPGAIAPPGPMSRILWIYDEATPVPPFDTAACGAGAGSGRLDPGRRRGPAQIGQSPGGGHPGARHQRRAQESGGDRPGDVAARRRRCDGHDRRLPGVPGAAADRQIHELHRRVAGRAESARVERAVDHRGDRRAQLQPLPEPDLRLPLPAGLVDQRLGERGTCGVARGDDPAEPGRAGHLALYADQCRRRLERIDGVTIDPYSWLAGIRAWKVIR
jgi:hypothetical protein